MTKKLLGTTMVLTIAGSTLALDTVTHPPAPRVCRVQGAWERVATIQAGKRTPFTGGRETKIVGTKYFSWLYGAARRDTLPLRTTTDTTRAFAMSGGFGTYDLAGDHYTEHLALFVDPRFEGRTLRASCRTDGTHWYHTYLGADLTVAAPGQTLSRDSTTEVWRRVE
jgi:hypothetical protein